jgi:hypothetical protein
MEDEDDLPFQAELRCLTAVPAKDFPLNSPFPSLPPKKGALSKVGEDLPK